MDESQLASTAFLIAGFSHFKIWHGPVKGFPFKVFLNCRLISPFFSIPPNLCPQSCLFNFADFLNLFISRMPTYACLYITLGTMRTSHHVNRGLIRSKSTEMFDYQSHHRSLLNQGSFSPHTRQVAPRVVVNKCRRAPNGCNSIFLLHHIMLRRALVV